MATTVTARTPAHLWIVGALALLWNAFGCFDYVMTKTGNAAYLAQFSPEEVAYFSNFPAWLTALWALGVWGALAGAVLLLLRSRHAVLAYAVSLFGMITSFGYQLLAGGMPASMKEMPMMAMTALIFAAGIAQLWYARKGTRDGILG